MGVSMALSTNIPMVRGNTKTIIIQLYKQSMGVQNIPDEHPTLIRMVEMDVKTARQYGELLNLPRANIAYEKVTALLGRLSTTKDIDLNTKKIIQNYVGRVNTFKDQVDRSRLDKDELFNQYAGFKKSKAKVLQILQAIEKGESPSQVDLDLLENNLKNFESNKKQLVSQLVSLNTALRNLEDEIMPEARRILGPTFGEAGIAPSAGFEVKPE